MTILYIDAFAGLSGDLFLGALADLGVAQETFVSLPDRLGLEGASIELETAKVRGIAAKRAVVEFPHEHAHRHLNQVQEILERSDLPKAVVEGAVATFRRLAEAEATLHGTTPDKIHFHEVGAVDAILDIAGTHLGIYELKVDRIVCSPIPLSRGQAQMAHGVMPLPAPATVELLRGAPTKSIDVDFETVTPTGAALAASLADAFGDWPEMTVERSGWGAATHEGGELPNLLRLVLGQASEATGADRVWVLECQIDDMNPEFFEPLWQNLFDAGALDVYLTPIQMKKGRQGTLLTVLAPEHLRFECERTILERTTTFGVRRALWDRTILAREIVEVETEYGPIPVKIAPGMPGKAAPEASAVKAAAEKAGVPMAAVYGAVMGAFQASKNSY
jgi:hypothetical protein